MSVASLSAIFDGGASDALVRQIAHRLALGDGTSARRLFSTGMLLSAIGCLFGSLVIYFVARHWMMSLIGAPDGSATAATFPIALLIAVANTLGNACSGVLEGFERYDLRLGIALCGILALTTLNALLIPAFGANGMVAAFFAQTAVVFSISIFAARRQLAKSGHGNWRPARRYASDLIRIGLPLKLFGLANWALEPLSRVLVGAFSGMHAVGAYEVAARLASQLRALIVGATQVILPRLVKLSNTDSVGADTAEYISIRMNGAVVGIGFGALLVVLPKLSALLTGNDDAQLVKFASILSIGWALNALSAPYFYACIANAQFKIIWASTGLMAIVNGSLGYILGTGFGSLGVAWALSVSIAAGSLFTIVGRTRTYRIGGFVYGRPELLLGLAVMLYGIASANTSIKGLFAGWEILGFPIVGMLLAALGALCVGILWRQLKEISMGTSP
jgi:O-antigen/teichoic acid export membrane protein